ncbi:DUF7002 family protein [Paenibacillus sp. FSL R5-0378]
MRSTSKFWSPHNTNGQDSLGICDKLQKPNNDFYDNVELSKYDSGSSPRFPARCSYKKNMEMFLALGQFEIVQKNDVPTKPSEIREVLVQEEVTNLSLERN